MENIFIINFFSGICVLQPSALISMFLCKLESWNVPGTQSTPCIMCHHEILSSTCYSNSCCHGNWSRCSATESLCLSSKSVMKVWWALMSLSELVSVQTKLSHYNLREHKWKLWAGVLLGGDKNWNNVYNLQLFQLSKLSTRSKKGCWLFLTGYLSLHIAALSITSSLFRWQNAVKFSTVLVQVMGSCTAHHLMQTQSVLRTLKRILTYLS